MSYLFLRFDALKGQQIIAQGFGVSVRLSSRRSLSRTAAPWVYGEQRNRPRDDIYKSEIHVSDENEGLIFPENEVLQFRPKGIIYFVHRIPADGFSPVTLSQGDALG
jgi:hypothetical protein